ncbi:MAG: hypothetical protein E5X53_26265 [Mesorhizobium sp.]|uniref:hypothetical protein n=1 Tax=Mesorhizobium sp. TaxID=1871066 RepID=UPI00122817B4|nr:hypothetical protein [Mesorhizobium sp.]TIP70570.1 MAG: hypothetical protein E5X55_26515 [Mesorhizobium sp.]TIQ06760.1 MAG: hypothetical protein E5X57_24225 [Mesorhizobium sp.]TIR49004.1 MAG: hypothetical protein E5X53_26265 [Mesorhizobium sp.]TJV94839.1 MAG: hypothetical protein E5X52_26790 [Mesorhizobium sp.]
MTLIVTCATHFFSVCVSDRLTTVDERTHDTLANKIVVARLDGALLTLGYTGLAYIDDLPTDEWLVRAVVPDLHKTVAFRFGDTRIPRTVEGFVSRIVGAVDKRARAKRDLWANPLMVGISGFKESRAGLRPYHLTITKERQGARLEFQLVTRHLHPRPDAVAIWISGEWETARPQIFNTMEKRLAEFLPWSPGAALEWRTILEDAVKAVAATAETVGPETMSVVHSPYEKLSVITFSGAAPHALPPLIASVMPGFDVHYSPWILGNHILMAPSVLSGSLLFELAGHRLYMRGGDNRDGLYFGAQDRMPNV